MKNAWLLTWEGTRGPALDPEKKIAAIVPARRGSKWVEQLMAVLYSRACFSAGPILYDLNKPKRTSVYSGGGRLFYGSNPSLCLYARQVIHFNVLEDEVKGVERLSWVEMPLIKNDSITYQLVEDEPEKVQTLVRSLNPISRDIFD